MNRRFFLRQSVSFFAEGDALHQEGHIIGQGTHGLKAFFVHNGLPQISSVNTVPVLAGYNRHIGYGEELVQFIKSSRASTSSCTDNAGTDFHGLVERGAVKEAVKTGNQGSICGSKVDRTCDNQPIGGFKFWGQFVDDIIENAFSVFLTGITGDASSYILVAK